MKSLESESPEADIKKNIQRGRDFRKKGNFDDAINSFENALFFYKELQYDQLLCEILYELGTLNALKGNNEKALNYFQKSADVFKERKDFQGLSLALGNLASINYYKKSDFEKALEYYNESIEIQEKLNDDFGLLENFNNMGNLSLDKGEYSKAIEFYNKSLILAEKISNDSEIGRAYNNIAIILKNLGSLNEAKEYFEKSLIFFRKANHGRGEAAVLGNIGTFAMEIGEWNTAICYLKKDLEISIRIEDILGKAESEANLGLLCSKMGLFKEAFNYYQNSLAIFKKLGYSENIVRTLNNLGDLNIKLGNWNNAKENLEEALRICPKPISKISIYLNIGDLLKKEKQYKKAYLYYKKAIKLIDEIGAKPMRIELFNKLGELYFCCYCSKGDEKLLELAKMQFNEALKLSNECQIKLSEAISLRNIGLVQQKTNKIENAIDSFKKSIEIFNKLGSKYESIYTIIETARILFENGNNHDAEFMVKSGLSDSVGTDFKVLQINGNILLGDITQEGNYYLNAIRLSMFDSIIYKRACYIIIKHIKMLDNDSKIKLLQDIKYINNDKKFNDFLDILIPMLKGEEYIINEGLPSSLRKELLNFELPK